MSNSEQTAAFYRCNGDTGLINLNAAWGTATRMQANLHPGFSWIILRSRRERCMKEAGAARGLMHVHVNPGLPGNFYTAQT